MPNPTPPGQYIRPERRGEQRWAARGIEPLTWSLGRGIAQLPAAVREVSAVGASVSALKTPKHRLMPIRTVSRSKWLTQNARETSLGSASVSNDLWKLRQITHRLGKH